ncbi:MAG: L,D-transpeptidase family protein [Coraliomargarita sp.]
MRKKLAFLIQLSIITGALVFIFGRSLWYPIYIKVQGGQSIADVLTSIEANANQGFDTSEYKQLRILCFKEERILEVWGIDANGSQSKLTEFPFTGYSGQLGPKLREGDRQIPEGLYRIEYLNPNSSYHLSMKLDYPNAFDRAKGEIDGREQLGYDIFIHGRSATIGCIPIGDPAIEQLFHMVASIGISKVEVVIAPYDMRVDRKHLEIDGIDWEDELYSLIKHALHKNAPAHEALGQE